MNTCLINALDIDAKPAVRWHPDGWSFRGVVTALAFAVSGLYAVTLFDQLGRVGFALLLGAALAWPTLLITLWFCSAPELRLARLDWCLWTMTVGSVFMALGLLVAQFVTPPTFALLGALGVADVAMGWVLTRYAPTVGVTRLKALLIWVLGMNGFLTAVVALTRAIDGIASVLLMLTFLAAPFALLGGVILLAIHLGRDAETPVLEETR